MAEIGKRALVHADPQAQGCGRQRAWLRTAAVQRHGASRAERGHRCRHALAQGKFGIEAILPAYPFDVRQHQLFPGRWRMLEQFARIERHAATVQRIEGRTVSLSDGTQLDCDLLLWGTGDALDLSWLEVPAVAGLRSLEALAARDQPYPVP